MIKLASESDIIRQFKKYKKLKYEGMVVRNINGVYKTSTTNSHMRSNHALKMKTELRKEFEVVGFTSGKNGRDRGALMWICSTKKGNRFKVTPKDMSIDDRISLFKKLSKTEKTFQQKFLGKMLTVSYFDISGKNGVPLYANAVEFRDYE